MWKNTRLCKLTQKSKKSPEIQFGRNLYNKTTIINLYYIYTTFYDLCQLLISEVAKIM